MQVKKAEPRQGVDSLLESHFSDTKFVFLPDSFTSVVTASVNYEIICSICSDLLLKHLGARCNRVDPETEWDDLGAEEKVITYCINFMAHQYIIIVLEYHSAGKVERILLCDLVIRAKYR
jgi:hypothetical protein